MKPLRLIFLAAALLLGYKLATDVAWQDAIGDSATAIFRPIAIHLINLINAPAFVYVASSVIILAAVVACVVYWIDVVAPSMKRLYAIRVAILSAPAGADTAGAGWKDVMSPVAAILNGDDQLAAGWRFFDRQARQAGEVPDVTYAACVAGAAPADARQGWMRSLPGTFTSIGLILTFIGLVVALYFAARGFRSGNMEEARLSIVQLLNASAFKFLTSVAALFSALSVSLFLQYTDARLDRLRQEIVAQVDNLIEGWRAHDVGFRRPALDIAPLIERLDAVVGELAALRGMLAAGPPAERPQASLRDAPDSPPR